MTSGAESWGNLMDEQDLLTRLAELVVEEGGRVTVSKSAGPATGFTVTRYRGEDLEYPTTIRTTRDAFHAYLESMGDGVKRLWPDVSRLRAGYNIFLVHLDEEMTVVEGNPDTIDITARQMKTHRERAYERPAYPPGDYEWRAGERGSSAS